MKALGKVFNNYVLGVLFLALIFGGVLAVYGVFTQKFTHYDKVTLSTDTTGLQLPDRADVKIRGVLIGEVTKAVSNGDGQGATLTLGIDPGKLSEIPSNVTASILPKTLFGEKYVELDIPKTGASPAAIRVGGHIAQTKRPIEVQAVLNNLYPLLRTLQPAEINYTLDALSTALRGKGEQLGDTIVTLKDYLARINPQVPALADDLGMLASANPPRHHDRLGVHVLQAVGLHRLDRPLNGAGEIGRAAQSGAKRVGQFGETPPCEVIRRCRLDQAIGVGPQWHQKRVGALGFKGGDNRDGADERYEA